MEIVNWRGGNSGARQEQEGRGFTVGVTTNMCACGKKAEVMGRFCLRGNLQKKLIRPAFAILRREM